MSTSGRPGLEPRIGWPARIRTVAIRCRRLVPVPGCISWPIPRSTCSRARVHWPRARESRPFIRHRPAHNHGAPAAARPCRAQSGTIEGRPVAGATVRILDDTARGARPRTAGPGNERSPGPVAHRRDAVRRVSAHGPGTLGCGDYPGHTHRPRRCLGADRGPAAPLAGLRLAPGRAGATAGGNAASNTRT